jgi:hypothetical protein
VIRRGLLLCLLLAAPLAAQRDFLTADEADQIREAQAPAARLALYAKFAGERIKMVEQLLAKEKPGRSLLVHDALEDYSNIIDAIDNVVDDALKRRLEVKLGLDAVTAMERETLAVLKRLEESRPKDLERYEFVLTQAIETAGDSLEASGEDLDARRAAAGEREAREKKELETLMSQKEVSDRKAQEKKTAAKEEEQKRKIPTLRRKGETVPPR